MGGRDSRKGKAAPRNCLLSKFCNNSLTDLKQHLEMIAEEAAAVTGRADDGGLGAVIRA